MNKPHQHFIDAGIKIEIEGPDYFSGKDSKLRYRWMDNQLQVGINKSFDRWVNSVDFVLHGCDAKRLGKVDVEALRSHIDRLISKGRHNKRWGMKEEITLRDMKRSCCRRS